MPQRRGAPPLTDAGALDCADVYARGVPHDRFDRLRSRTPVVWQDGRTAGRPGGWAVLRYADVHRALRRPELFSPLCDGVLHGPMIGDAPEGGRPPGDPRGAALIDMDPLARAMRVRFPRVRAADLADAAARGLPPPRRNALAGGLHAMLHLPGESERLRAERSDEELVHSAVEEMLRW